MFYVKCLSEPIAPASPLDNLFLKISDFFGRFAGDNASGF